MLNLITCVGVDYDLDFIPQWSRYYSQYGLTHGTWCFTAIAMTGLRLMKPRS